MTIKKIYNLVLNEDEKNLIEDLLSIDDDKLRGVCPISKGQFNDFKIRGIWALWEKFDEIC